MSSWYNGGKTVSAGFLTNICTINSNQKKNSINVEGETKQKKTLTYILFLNGWPVLLTWSLRNAMTWERDSTKSLGLFTTLMADPLFPAGHHVLVLCHHSGHHPVLQLLPAKFLDAFSPGHCYGGRPAAVALQPLAQVQVSTPRTDVCFVRPPVSCSIKPPVGEVNDIRQGFTRMSNFSKHCLRQTDPLIPTALRGS